MRRMYIFGTLCPYRSKGRRVKRERMKIQAWEADRVRTWREEGGSEA